jgi:hypothetical protein
MARSYDQIAPDARLMGIWFCSRDGLPDRNGAQHSPPGKRFDFGVSGRTIVTIWFARDGSRHLRRPRTGAGFAAENLKPMAGRDVLLLMMKDAAGEWNGAEPLRVLQ